MYVGVAEISRRNLLNNLYIIDDILDNKDKLFKKLGCDVTNLFL